MRESASQASSATMSKPEAVRRAIAALGYRAELTQILDYVHKHFGIEATAPPAPATRPAADALTAAEDTPGDQAQKTAGKRPRTKDRAGPTE